jgi:hypothetical protein
MEGGGFLQNDVSRGLRYSFDPSAGFLGYDFGNLE